jgi:ribosomal protein S18 acetylase RimI-like enzyme
VLEVRRIRPGDAALLRDVRLRALATDPQSFGSTYEREAAYADEQWQECCRGDAEGDEMTTLLALDGEQAIGIVAGARDDDDADVYAVFAMWVDPKVRGTGVGRRLLGELEEWMRTAGATTVHLSVTNQADAAQALYERAGYERDGTSSPSRHTEGLVEIGLRKKLTGA